MKGSKNVYLNWLKWQKSNHQEINSHDVLKDSNCNKLEVPSNLVEESEISLVIKSTNSL